MTRSQAKEDLKVTFGIEEPTEDQITNYLNRINAETKRERERADKYKTDAEKAVELQKQLDDLNEQGMSDLDKANKRIAELEKIQAISERKANLAKHGIVGEDADKLFGEDGAIDFELLGKIITDRETAAASKKEKEILDGTPNPGGAKGGKQEDKSEAEVIGETIGKEMASAAKSANDVIGAYL